MKFIASILLTALLSFVICLYMDWWAIAIAAFIVSILIHQKPRRSFLTGFIALFVLWSGLSLWLDAKNEHILSHKIALLMSLGGSSFLLVIITGITGALVGGFAALAASYIREKK